MATRDELLNEGDKDKKDEPVIPYRAQLNLTTAHMDISVVEEMLDGLMQDAEGRGFNIEWGYMDEMALEDVIPGSPLDLVVRGEDSGPQEP